jgi:hypothetical protein
MSISSIIQKIAIKSCFAPNIKNLVQKSHEARKKAEQLLDKAKRKVEP